LLKPLLTIALALLAGPAGAQTWNQLAKVLPESAMDDPDVEAVALWGDTLVTGVPVGGFGFGGSEVFVYERNFGGPGNWGLVQTLTSSLPQNFQYYGDDLDIEADTIVVGATAANTGGLAGRVFVYERGVDPTVWNETKLILPAVQDFGWSVSLSGDTLVVGGSGGAAVYERNLGGADNWGLRTVLDPTLGSGNGFGQASSISGDTVVVGAWYGLGRAFVFERDQGGPNTWGQVALLTSGNPTSSGWFGQAVAALDDAVICGARHESIGGVQSGAAYVFERDAGGPDNWGRSFDALPPSPQYLDEFGTSVSASRERFAVGSPLKSIGYDMGTAGGLAFDPASGTVYVTDVHQAADSDLVSVDPSTALGTLIGDIGLNDVMGSAYDPATGTLYATERDTAQLLSLDPASGAATVIGVHGQGNVAGLAFDPGTNTLYGANNVNNRLVTIDPLTGAATSYGKFGYSSVRSLAFDPATGVLYGSDSNTQVLIDIDPATGAAYTIGAIGYNLRGLAFDSTRGLLLGISGQQLIEINPATGAGTAVGSLDRYKNGAAYVYERAGSSWVETDEVHTKQTFYYAYFAESVSLDGETLAIGCTQGGAADGGSAFLFGHSDGVETYCTAGTSASGCTALLSASGTPSATAASGFDLSAAGVEGAKDGLFFFGVSGRQANSWGSSTSFQCVVPPVIRTALLSGSGTPGVCDGAFSRDMNALWCVACTHPAKNPGAGATVQAQLWYRDPQNTSNRTTSLSDAVEFGVGP
jgi:hypothetical protein